MRCPKCKTGLIITKYYDYCGPANVCMSCGCSHQIGALKESLQRQVVGVMAWKNPRVEAPIKSNQVSTGVS